MASGKEVKAVIYLDDLVSPQQRPQAELGQRATIRYGYDEPERSDFLKTMAYIVLVVITLLLFMKAIGVKTF